VSPADAQVDCHGATSHVRPVDCRPARAESRLWWCRAGRPGPRHGSGQGRRRHRIRGALSWAIRGPAHGARPGPGLARHRGAGRRGAVADLSPDDTTVKATTQSNRAYRHRRTSSGHAKRTLPVPPRQSPRVRIDGRPGGGRMQLRSDPRPSRICPSGGPAPRAPGAAAPGSGLGPRVDRQQTAAHGVPAGSFRTCVFSDVRLGQTTLAGRQAV